METLTKDSHISRFIDLIDPKMLEVPVTIIGAGSIGSFAALALAKIGWRRLTIIDFDTVEEHNLGVQLHRLSDLGKNKAIALADVIHGFTGSLTEVTPINAKWDGQTFPGVVIPAVDNLAVRSQVWEAHLDSFKTKFVVDARMGAEVASLYVMNPSDPRDRNSYPKSLTSDERAETAPCTAKSTTYTAVMLGGLIAQAVKDALCSPIYLRTAEWNIKNYTFRAWMSDGTARR